MLQNCLGTLLEKRARKAKRFVDLFSGSAAVAWYIAEKINKPVLAVDLQSFATTLAKSILGRTGSIDAETLWLAWQVRAEKWLVKHFRRTAINAQLFGNEVSNNLLKKQVADAKFFCSRLWRAPITHAYGGYYYSPHQALQIDALRATVPRRTPNRDVALAALIEAASACAAAPGHTAQPFGNTPTARKWIHEAWKRDVLKYTKNALINIAARHALRKGKARVGNANDVAKTLRKGDLVFLDPPYSGVHYSRFYHVLETLARGRKVKVTGTGRYPPIAQRPPSRYSMRGKSKEALAELLSILGSKQVRVVLTFPAGRASNNLSGRSVTLLAKKYFTVRRIVVTTRFSTLGGNGGHRDSHQSKGELILVLKPRCTK